MVIGMMPMTSSAATDCIVTDNIIDITDKTVYEKKAWVLQRLRILK